MNGQVAAQVAGKVTGKRVTVFYGNFGGGKTELAINYAIQQAARHGQAVLVDADNVTPFFRSRDVAADLEKVGVSVVAPKDEIRKADIPVLTPEVLGVLANPEARAVFDVGGNQWGARLIGSLAGRFPVDELDAFFVVNTRRPFSRNMGEIISSMREIARAARMEPTAVVNSTNLGRLTSFEMIIDGLNLVESSARSVGLEVAFSTCPEWLVEERGPTGGRAAEPTGFFRRDGRLFFAIRRYMAPPWE